MDKDYIDILNVLINEKSYLKLEDIYIKIKYKESKLNAKGTAK